MLKYYEYLLRIRTLLRDNFGISVLANLESFPVDLDPSLREYHEKIAARIDSLRSTSVDGNLRARYYIHKTRPFFADGRIYYEVTFYRAVNKVSKPDRIIAFTDIDMTDRYSAMLTLQQDAIEILDQTMPITVIRDWEVSIRPCEFDNFARLFDVPTETRISSSEYVYLMRRLTAGSGSLLDLVDMPDDKYKATRAEGTALIKTPQIFAALDEARRIVRSGLPGHNVMGIPPHPRRTARPGRQGRRVHRLGDPQGRRRRAGTRTHQQHVGGVPTLPRPRDHRRRLLRNDHPDRRQAVRLCRH